MNTMFPNVRSKISIFGHLDMLVIIQITQTRIFAKNTCKKTKHLKPYKQKYIEQQTSFIIAPKSKQILRYGEHPLGVYEHISKCRMIQYNNRNYIDDGTFQNEKIPPIPITFANQNLDLHPTSFFLGIAVTLLLIFA